MNHIFVGLPFTEISLYLFREFQAICFGVNSFDPEDGSYKTLLNPGRDYSLKQDDFLFVVCSKYRYIKDIMALVIIC
jgi:hypothetical protein